MPAKTKPRSEREPKTDQPKEGGKRGALKANRAAKRRSHYAGNPARVLRNKQRRMAKRLREHPADEKAIQRYIELYGKASALSHAANATRRGIRRLRRGLDRQAAQL
jgi:hypothetical protein